VFFPVLPNLKVLGWNSGEKVGPVGEGNLKRFNPQFVLGLGKKPRFFGFGGLGLGALRVERGLGFLLSARVKQGAPYLGGKGLPRILISVAPEKLAFVWAPPLGERNNGGQIFLLRPQIFSAGNSRGGYHQH